MSKIKIVFLIISGAILLLSTLFIQSCAISPLAWQPLTKPLFEGKTKLNNELASIEKIDLDGGLGESLFYQPNFVPL